MSHLESDEVDRLCRDLVFKVSYSFYDEPYRILLWILVEQGVMTEKALSDLLGVGVNDVRKYIGMLHTHRLVKRHVNKEKASLSTFQQRTLSNGGTVAGVAPGQTTRTRDVIYWYLDYREFADVVKYRIAMMRRAIDEKMKGEVGKRGYLCPLCHKVYDPLDLGHLFDSSAGAFLCEVDSTELIEDDPSMHGDDNAGQGQDRMQRFNVATAPIRDALKRIEGATLPSENIVSWIARNVRTEAAAPEAEGAQVRAVDVVFGEGARQEEKKKVHAALPAWEMMSTITGEMTAEGHAAAAKAAKDAAAAEAAAGPSESTHVDDDLADYYQNQNQNFGDEELGDTAESTPAPDTSAMPSAVATPSAVLDVIVMVAGKPKKVADVTQEDEALMTPDEYEAFFDVTNQ